MQSGMLLWFGTKSISRPNSKFVLNQQEYSEITSITGRFHQNELLLSAVEQKSHDQQLKFIEALKESKQRHLAVYIETGGEEGGGRYTHIYIYICFLILEQSQI